jgi:hypothetical protein
LKPIITLSLERSTARDLDEELRELVAGLRAEDVARRQEAVERWRKFAAWFNTGHADAIWTRLRFWYKPWTWLQPQGAWIVPNDSDSQVLP